MKALYRAVYADRVLDPYSVTIQNLTSCDVCVRSY